jgi:hypothetical protein
MPAHPLDAAPARDDDWHSMRVIVGALSSLGAMVVVTAVAAAAGAGTALHTYTPFSNHTIANGVRVARTTAGSCWTTSIADARSDAFRCTVGNEIYDPCFAPAAAASTDVVCPLYVPGAPVLLIALTKALPRPGPSVNPRRYSPWAVQLKRGTWCTLETGASGVVAGLRVSYNCAGGGVLLGTIARAANGWTLRYAASDGATASSRVTLRAAWW